MVCETHPEQVEEPCRDQKEGFWDNNRRIRMSMPRFLEKVRIALRVSDCKRELSFLYKRLHIRHSHSDKQILWIPDFITKDFLLWKVWELQSHNARKTLKVTVLIAPATLHYAVVNCMKIMSRMSAVLCSADVLLIGTQEMISRNFHAMIIL